MKKQWKWVGLLLLGMPLAAGAQETASSSQAELIRELLARVARLESRVAELENQPQVFRPASEVVLAHMVSTEPAAPLLEPSQAALQAPGTPPTPGADTQPTYPSLHLAGFSDLAFASTDQRGFRS